MNKEAMCACGIDWIVHTSTMKERCRNMRAVEISQRPSVSDVPWLLEERARLVKLHALTLDNLTRVQARSTEQTNDSRGMNLYLKKGADNVFRNIIGNAYAAICKHGDFIPRLLPIADGTGGADAVAFRGIAQAECAAAERGEKLLTWRKLVEEEIGEAFAETDPHRLMNELAQATVAITAWMHALEIRMSGGAEKP